MSAPDVVASLLYMSSSKETQFLFLSNIQPLLFFIAFSIVNRLLFLFFFFIFSFDDAHCLTLSFDILFSLPDVSG
jgi:hypothetical protein